MPKIRKLFYLPLLCLSLLLLPAVGYCTGITTTSNELTVTMSVTQYEMLKSSIETLKKNSIEREKLINQQNQQIKTLKEQLTISRTQMQNSQSSISQTQTLLNQQNESLETLTKQINAESHKYIVAKRQRDAWAVLAGGLFVGLIAK